MGQTRSRIVDVEKLESSLSVKQRLIIYLQPLQSKLDLLENQSSSVALDRVNRNRPVVIRYSSLERREIVFFVAEVRMLKHELVVLKHIALDASLLPHKVLGVLAEKFIRLIHRFAPVSICGRILAVNQSDGGERILIHVPVVLDAYVVPIFKAERLLIPGLSVSLDECVEKFLRAVSQFVLFVELERLIGAGDFVTDVVKVGIVENIKIIGQIADAGDKVHAVVLAAQRDVHIVHGLL